MTSLGPCVAEYRLSAAGYAKLLAIMVASLAVGGGMLWIALAGGDSNTGGRVVLGILGLLFLLPVALGVYGLTKGRRNGIRVHENGVVLRQRGEDAVVLFDDVEAYSDAAFLEITGANDESFTFGLSGLANEDDLFRRLREEIVVKRRLPRVMKALAAGEVAEFGSEEQEGVRRDPSDVGGYAVDPGGVTLAGSRRRVAWSEIVEHGSRSRVLAGPGRMQRTAGSVFLRTSEGTVEAVVEPRSERELLLAVCGEMRAKGQRQLTASSSPSGSSS